MIFRDVSIIAIGALYKQQFVLAVACQKRQSIENRWVNERASVAINQQWRRWQGHMAVAVLYLDLPFISHSIIRRRATSPRAKVNVAESGESDRRAGVILRGNFTKLTAPFGAVNSTCIPVNLRREKKKKDRDSQSVFSPTFDIGRNIAVGALSGRVEGIRLYRLPGCVIPICYRGTRKSVMRRAATS